MLTTIIKIVLCKIKNKIIYNIDEFLKRRERYYGENSGALF